MSVSEAVPRSSLRLLVDRKFGTFFWTKTLSLVAMWTQNIAAAIVIYDLTQSATMVGLITVSQFISLVVLAPWTGALTDIVDRRQLLIVGRVISGLSSAVLFAVPMFGGSLTTPLMLWMTFVLGLGIAISSPALQALVPALVPPADLESAVALNAVIGNIARAVGPGLGAVLMLIGGPEAAFAFAAFSHLAFAGAMVVVRTPKLKAGAGRRRILDGFRYLREDREMTLLLIAVAALGFGVDPILTLTPAIAEMLRSDAGGVGWMASTFGVTAVIAAGILGTMRRWMTLRVLGVFGFVVLAVGLAVVALAPAVSVAVAGFGIAGFGFLIATTGVTTRIQRDVPEEIRGRIMALWTVAFLGSRPLAAAVNGAITDLLSVRAAVGFGVAISVAALFLANTGSPRGSDETGSHHGVAMS